PVLAKQNQHANTAAAPARLASTAASALGRTRRAASTCHNGGLSGVFASRRAAPKSPPPGWTWTLIGGEMLPGRCAKTTFGGGPMNKMGRRPAMVLGLAAATAPALANDAAAQMQTHNPTEGKEV